MDAKESRLPNGIRVASAALPHVQSVAMGVFVGVGGRYEPKSISGVSHFIEHLLFKGTRTLTAGDISRAIEGRGGYFNAFTQEDLTCYFAKVACNHAWKVLGILCDMTINPRFARDDIEKERSVILEEMMMYRDRPDQVVNESLNELLWPDHELGRPLVGNEETIAAMRRSDIVEFKARRYVTGNTLFAFAGRVEHDACVERVAALTGRLGGAPAPRCAPVKDGMPQGRAVLQKKKVEQTQMALGFRIFGRHDPRRYAMKVLSVVLGENMSSRLFQVVREKHGLAYSVSSSFTLFAETGAIVICAGLERAHGGRALALIAREVRRLKDDLVGPRELARAREYILGQLRLSLETPSSQMMWIGENLVSYGRNITAEEAADAVRAVTARDVQALAREFLSGARMSLSVVSPELEAGDEPRLLKILKAI
ncbi:MAG: insulinase family protein [Lentisphaerae bacterium]|nr:insulinase family protein [Lentisphaerota bacterium]